jgi:nucleotide-binding universal stress UspA family protein
MALPVVARVRTGVRSRDRRGARETKPREGVRVTYKTILVHVDNGRRCAARVTAAVELAVRFDAHLIGLHAVTPAMVAAYRMVNPGPEFMTQHAERAAALAESARASFVAAASAGGLASLEWRTSADDPVAAIALSSRYSDLVVLGQPEPASESGVEPSFARRAVLAAGRPVFVMPYAGTFERPGRRMLLAWNAGREATRAATDALPFLRGADEVAVVMVRPSGSAHGDLPGADVGTYLARHGVKVRVEVVHAKEVDAGNLLLSRASDLGSDLLVLGAYGHSRFSELVLGGVTQTMFESMTIPVLMSH